MTKMKNIADVLSLIFITDLLFCGEGGSRTHEAREGAGFRNRCNRPLCDLS